MVKKASSPSSFSSPVKITISPGGKLGSRSIGLTSPIFRTSISGNNPNSPIGVRANRRASTGELTSSEFVSYTVHIPPTPDHQPMKSSLDELAGAEPEKKSFISGTIFTGGFNSVTRGHVIENSIERVSVNAKKPGLVCWMKGCDEKATKNQVCECGFKICSDCYSDCFFGSEGKCPGCKEKYKNADSESDSGSDERLDSEAEDEALPLPRLDRRLSLVKSMKNQPEFDHTRWLFETRGTYGYGNALWPKEGYGSGFEPPPDFGERNSRPLTRKVGVSTAIISPYRLLVAIRLVALGLFLTWRVRHPNRDAMWLWGVSTTCEIWFALSWLLDQLPKLRPVNRSADLSVLSERFESPTLRNPKGRSDLPGVDVFVSTADPEKEPPLVTANTVLSILAADYPVEKLACYVSDDGGSLLTFEALAEAAGFSATWVPFCRKHRIEPRNPEAYFALPKRDFLRNKVRVDFVRERRRVKREYDEFKVRINSLPESIRRRSDAYNAHEELRSKKKEIVGSDPPLKMPKATWMSDGSHWPGTWASAESDHARGDHAGIIQVMLAPPNSEVVYGSPADGSNLMDSTETDMRVPMLVYVSREKRPGFDHNKKAGAMNALVRTSAVMSNGPFVLNLDCDHYVHYSGAVREGMCFMLDPRSGSDRVAFVQFPQRFEGVDPNDRYANHNAVFFDVSMRALDGIQGPVYVGTGCLFRRTALYGFDPPRATERRGWFGRSKKKVFSRRKKSTKEEEEDVEAVMVPKQFGNSEALAESIQVAEFQGRAVGDGPTCRPAGSLVAPREPLDAAAVSEAVSVISCFYEEKTEWGRRVGWIYGSVTEDVVTGYRMHNRGWRSVYCVTKRDAFRGSAPINLTDRLHQVLRWATGSVEIFFSRNNPLFASPRMKLLQRIAYFNVGVYPFTSFFLLAYCFLPAVSLFSGQFIVQGLDAVFLSLLLLITVTLCLLAILEVKWSGITLDDWWRNEQFWVIGGTSAHPSAVLQGLLKVVAGVDVNFTLTAKSSGPAEGEPENEFAELYEVRWSFLMVPPVVIMMVNAVAIAVGTARTMYSPFPEWSKLVGGVFFSFWVLSHLHPFAKGLMGRRGKVPTIVFVWSGLISIVISMLWVMISSSPSGSQQQPMSFHFP